MRLGRCFYRHDPLPAPAPCPATLLEQSVLQEDSVGCDMATLLRPWFLRCNPEALVLHDPYLASVRRSSRIYPACERLDPDELVALVSDAGLVESTYMVHWEELLQVARADAPRLRSVHLHTRGLLRAGTPASGILMPWFHELRARWAPLGLDLRLTVNNKLHSRRLVMVGAGCSLEVCIEWGIAYHVDTVANIAREPLLRQCRRTEVLVIAHPSGWLADPPVTPAPETPRSQHPGLGLLIQRLLLASRRRSWRGRIWCNRCWSCGEADGAYAAFPDGRICRITRGGLPVRLAQELDLLTQVQCGECAVAPHGRGASYQEQ